MNAEINSVHCVSPPPSPTPLPHHQLPSPILNPLFPIPVYPAPQHINHTSYSLEPPWCCTRIFVPLVSLRLLGILIFIGIPYFKVKSFVQVLRTITSRLSLIATPQLHVTSRPQYQSLVWTCEEKSIL